MKILRSLDPIPLRRRIFSFFPSLVGVLLTLAGLITGAPVHLIVIMMLLVRLKGKAPCRPTSAMTVGCS